MELGPLEDDDADDAEMPEDECSSANLTFLTLPLVVVLLLTIFKLLTRAYVGELPLIEGGDGLNLILVGEGRGDGLEFK